MRLRVKIDHARCLQTGTCTGLSSALFTQGEDGHALVKLRTGAAAREAVLDGLAPDEAGAVREAAMFCPPEAISVWDEDTGEQLFP